MSKKRKPRPVKNPDYAALRKSIMARYPKVLERLAKLERRIESLESSRRDALAGYPGYD